MAKKTIMTPEDITRTLARIAHEIIERNKFMEQLLLVGMPTRGVPLARRLAVFIDRGHREMPIRADYIGKNIPSSRYEEIQVQLVETDGIDEVAVISPANNRHPSSKLKRVGNLKEELL